MGRPKNEVPSRRVHLTVDDATADALEAYARSVDRRTATAAVELLEAGLARAAGVEAEELAAARRRVDELEREVSRLERGRRGADEDSVEERPRWEWPVEALLADRAWWDRWLPRLYELLGRPGWQEASSAYGGQDQPPTDGRGYRDLMALLFPPMRRAGGAEVGWRSPDYGIAAQQAARAAHEGADPPARHHVWEPVVRHLAVALSDLEESGGPGATAQARRLAAEWIAGTWVRTLRDLIGEDNAGRELPRGPVK